MDLKAIYLTSLARCAPDAIVRAHVDPSMPRNVVSIGKCAGPLLDGVASLLPVAHAFVAVPKGYRLPATPAEVHVGGHPHMTADSFAAGRALVEFVRSHRDILFLISGGGSACVEVAAPGLKDEQVAAENARLVASGLPIGAINARRKELSAIKGGRLRELVGGRAITLVYSDVASGAASDVASGPTIVPGEEAIVIADNTTLVRAAAGLIGPHAVRIDEQIECDVTDAARLLAERASSLNEGEILVAGGEPTVVVRGDGKGGRCSELAVRFAALSPFAALFGSSDGVDGNSGAAGWHLPSRAERVTLSSHEAALARSDSALIAAQVGEPIMIAATGNNLRDLFLIARQARDSQPDATVRAFNE